MNKILNKNIYFKIMKLKICISITNKKLILVSIIKISDNMLDEKKKLKKL